MRGLGSVVWRDSPTAKSRGESNSRAPRATAPVGPTARECGAHRAPLISLRLPSFVLPSLALLLRQSSHTACGLPESLTPLPPPPSRALSREPSEDCLLAPRLPQPPCPPVALRFIRARGRQPSSLPSTLATSRNFCRRRRRAGWRERAGEGH